MDRRSKILAWVFGAGLCYALIAKTVYPTYIEPLLSYGERIAERQAELDKLVAIDEMVNEARFTYKSYVQRTGSFDMAGVENAIRQRLSTLIELHNLKDWTVSPGRKSVDRKTHVKSMLLTIQAQGSVEGVAGLLRDVAELPHLVRFGNVSINPTKSALSKGRITLHENVNVRLPIEIKVLPQHRLVGRIEEASLGEPEPHIRHARRDYSALWSGRPFSDYIKPQPLLVDAGKDQILSKPGRTVAFRGSATGGIGEYTFQWSPSDGLQTPTKRVTRVDTSKPGEKVYTLTVTDETGASHSDTVTLTIAEPRKPRPVVAERKPVPQKGPPEPNRWGDRRFMQVVMSLGQTYHGERRDELMVYERKNKQTAYYAAGDEFDGGELVYVHQTGGLVRRNDEYYVYPIGAPLDKELKLEQAEAFPELLRAADIHRRRLEAKSTVKDVVTVPATGEDASSGAPAKETKEVKHVVVGSTPPTEATAGTPKPHVVPNRVEKQVPPHPAGTPKADTAATKPGLPRGAVGTTPPANAESKGRTPPSRRPRAIGKRPR